MFDIIFSLIGLVITLPLFLVIVFLIKRESAGPVFYSGKRVGRHGRIFKMIKFRTMVPEADKLGGPSTAGDDPRLLKIGRALRRRQLDELPQFINILKGDMSFVGPRPEVPSEVETYDEETKRIILSVRPGLTDLATLENLHEEEVLKGAADPHQAYRELIKPKKLELARQYVQERSFWLDLKIIFKTLSTALF